MIALWNPVVYQRHPEDAFAVAFGLWGLLAASDGRWKRAGWLMGVGIAFQPLLLLALVVVMALAKRKEIAGLLVRSIAPAAVLVAGPIIANPRVTLRAIVAQPNSAITNRPTPWVHLAPHLGNGIVASGPARTVAVLAAGVLSWIVCRRNPRLEVCVWMLGVCFATRVAFEPVMVAYYIWPALAAVLLVASLGTSRRFALVCGLSSFATLYVHEWRSWTILLISIGGTLVASRPCRPADSSATTATSHKTGHFDIDDQHLELTSTKRLPASTR